MNRFLRSVNLALCAGFLAAQLVSAQDSPATPATQTAHPPRGPRPNPTNIKVLPKDTTGDEVIKVMHQYEGDLGVECEFCHARNPETHRNDFASDANPMKDRARIMIKMTDDLNAKYLTQIIGDHKPENPITCGTCHRGMSHPEAFVPKPHERANPQPATPARPS